MSYERRHHELDFLFQATPWRKAAAEGRWDYEPLPDYFFHRKDGPAHWANARLVRYADDLVVLARYQGDKLQGWIRQTLEKPSTFLI